MNEYKLLHHLRLAIHGDAAERRQAAVYLEMAEEQAREEAAKEQEWADMRDGVGLLPTLRKFSALQDN